MIVDLVLILTLYLLLMAGLKIKHAGKALLSASLLYVVLRQVLRFRENATNVSDSIVTELLTTQQAQNNEIASLFTVQDNNVLTDKFLFSNKGIFVSDGGKIAANGQMNAMNGIKIGYYAEGTDFDNWQGSINKDNNKLNIHGFGTEGNRGIVLKDDVTVNSSINVNDNAHIGQQIGIKDGIKIGYTKEHKKDSDNWQGSIHKHDNKLHITGYGLQTGDRGIVLNDDVTVTSSLAAEKFCINGACLTEDHIKMLKGEIPIHLKRDNHNRWLYETNGSAYWTGTENSATNIQIQKA